MQKKRRANPLIRGFTLTEVLTTLTILGVVAALTIPTIVHFYEEKSTVAKIYKYSSLLNQIITTYAANKGCTGNLVACGDLSDFNTAYQNILKPYLTTIKECSNGQGCFPTGVRYKLLNGLESLIWDTEITDRYKVILIDGSILSFFIQPNCPNGSISGVGSLSRVCAHVHIDINGNKPPNQSGRDFFGWRITNDARAIPIGTSDDPVHGCDPSSSDLTGGADGSPGLGPGCTAKVFLEGAVNY